MLREGSHSLTVCGCMCCWTLWFSGYWVSNRVYNVQFHHLVSKWSRCGTNNAFFQNVIASLYILWLCAPINRMHQRHKLGLFLKQGGEVNYFCLKQFQQGLKAFAAYLYPNFPWVCLLPWGGGRGEGQSPWLTFIYSAGHWNCSIYTQNAREKHACRITWSLNYT